MAKGPKILVIGSGFGCRIQIPALREAGFAVAALLGTDQARTEERAAASGVPLAFTDLEKAIAATGATAVAIATPPNTHAQLALQAIAHGCHVLCEKPFCSDTAEAIAMLEAAERAGIVHALGNEFRWDPLRRTAGRVLEAGQIGVPRFITLTQYLEYSSSSYVDLPHWWFDKAAGGGWLGASGSHLVDWVRSWLGGFESVSASLASVTAPAGGAEDSFIVRFRLRNGAEGVLQQTSGAYGPFAEMVRVAGTTGTLWLENGALKLATRDGVQAIPIAEDLRLGEPPPPSADPRQASPEWQMLASVELAPYAALCTAWRDAIEGRPQNAMKRPDFLDGVENMRVIDAIRESARQGGALVKLAA
jgi:predicted dehydrogenase